MWMIFLSQRGSKACERLSLLSTLAVQVCWHMGSIPCIPCMLPQELSLGLTLAHQVEFQQSVGTMLLSISPSSLSAHPYTVYSRVSPTLLCLFLLDSHRELSLAPPECLALQNQEIAANREAPFDQEHLTKIFRNDKILLANPVHCCYPFPMVIDCGGA